MSAPDNGPGRPVAGAARESRVKEPGPTTTRMVPDIEPDAGTLSAALAYAAAGIYVLPVKYPTKSPGSVVGKRWHTRSSRDPQQIVAWFAGTDYGIALHCGRSGLLVFDVDHLNMLPDILAKHLGSAPYQSSRPDDFGRGHYIFAMPPGHTTLGNGTGGLGGEWGEIRGLNGVIIVAPSRHADGGEYRWVRTGLVPVLPDEVDDLLSDGNPAEDAANDEQVAAFLAEHIQATRPEILRGWIKALQNHFETRSRHDGTVSVTVGAMKEARAGYFSAKSAADLLESKFVTAATRPPTGGERQRTEHGARDEFKSIFAWAVAQANAADLDEVRIRTEEKMPDKAQRVDNLGDGPSAVPPSDTEKVTHSAHLGMANKLGKQFEGKLLYVNKIGWHHWDGKRWAPDGNGAARRAVHTVIKRDRQIVKSLDLPSEEEEKRLKQIARYETASAITGILTEAAALQVVSVEVSDLDPDPWLFNCANGTLDLHTVKLHKHDPGDRITKVANAAYRADATGTDWTKFLNRVQPDVDVRGYLQRLTGSSLLGEVNGDKQIAPIMTGAGANGKTTWTEAITFAMGDYAMTAEPTLLMAKRGDAHPTGVADLVGRRFVSLCETEKGRRFDIALLKWLTGGDTLKARLMRQDFFSFQPSFLLMMATNHLPQIDDDTEAVWRRIRVIPFTVEIPKRERDEQLKERLRAEADAVLGWIIAGWNDYRKRGALDEPSAVLAQTEQYKTDSDTIGRFIAEECNVGGAQSAATTSTLYSRWETWADKDVLPLSRKAFGQALTAKGYPPDPAGDRLRRGICLKPPEREVAR